MARLGRRQDTALILAKAHQRRDRSRMHRQDQDRSRPVDHLACRGQERRGSNFSRDPQLQDSSLVMHHLLRAADQAHLLNLAASNKDRRPRSLMGNSKDHRRHREEQRHIFSRIAMLDHIPDPLGLVGLLRPLTAHLAPREPMANRSKEGTLSNSNNRRLVRRQSSVLTRRRFLDLLSRQNVCSM